MHYETNKVMMEHEVRINQNKLKDWKTEVTNIEDDLDD
jgi:hypothetical protein